MTNFMTALARFYPCTWCARDFKKNLEQKPVRTTNRKELCQWLCEQHNIVNVKTGKPVFDCDMTTLDERWRKSETPECKGSYLHH
jgi:mitochondrial FAD-linked sulfhydryl oxidase